MPLVRIDLRRGKPAEYRLAIGQGVHTALVETCTVIIQITMNEGRATDIKRALYARIVELVTAKPGLRKEDVLISLVEVKKECWSFGNGVAQYVT